MAYAGAAGAGYAASTAVALAVVAAGATAIAEDQRQQELADMESQQVQLGDQAAIFDKGAAQDKADLADLKVGEDDSKGKRKRGKAAFKIELDKAQKDKAEAQAGQGAQVSRPDQVGVQL